ncbi:hypothetical protein K7395_22795 [Streptomyces filamentosus]|uniref:Integral membrane protein n=2 Tax=Streptomyces filamentosus TaxID=67294 RepID=A0ABY4UYZ1_STRFL|nr:MULTISPECIES: hypothetical protein [Streptomyces]MYR79057.1 hypothetical protein [Streptomyces sp. SID5466]EFE74967.1 integral membrane protein [Streptomyces filamentosus NRRL 15998]ESU47729.1 putative integral membrane protein [Streptomyces sp. HCCB10043]EWS92034.1 hypothetical protein SSIG_02522 [Streptomyces filamentosus NRRL 11379]USC49344.1 hypothetical protein K7395_22795 [Streptomyces filamentosus]
MPLFSAASAASSAADLPPAATAGDGAEGAARPSLWLPSPYLVLGGLLWAVLSAAAWQAPLCCEAGLQAAVVERLRVNLLHPAFPMTDLPAVASAHYSPYALLQGLAARATGLSGPSVVALAASVNLLLLLGGIGRLTRLLTPNRWVPVLLLVPLGLIHWADPARWSAPTTFAVAVTLHVWAWTGRVAARVAEPGDPAPGRTPRWFEAAGIGVLLGLVLLVHPQTAIGAGIGCLALIAFRTRTRIRPTVWRWAFAGVCAVTVAALWPYYNGLTAPRAPIDSLTTAAPAAEGVKAAGEPYAWATAYVPPGEVVLTDSRPAMYALAGHGAYVLADALPDAGLATTERQERSRAVAAYLDVSTPQARRNGITARYGVRWLLLTRHQRLPENATVLAFSPRTGEVLARVAAG